MLVDNKGPNPAHKKLAELEKAGMMTGVVTQNIDGLHTLAGSEKVFELHGSVHRNYCTRCRKFYTYDYIKNSKDIPVCSCGGIIKPDVVLYGESLDSDCITGAVRAISEADLMIIGGTSLAVYPAAGLIGYFKGDNIVLINRDRTSADGNATLVIREPIGKVLGDIKVKRYN